MSDFKQQYKNPRPGFTDVDHRRLLRAHKCDKTRREVRTRAFDRNRNLQGVSAPTSPQPAEDLSNITDERMKKLIKWKEARNRRKQLESLMKKPAFKVGVVHHSLCSPLIKNYNASTVAASTSKKVERSNHNQKRITRATEKRLFAKELAAKQTMKDQTAMSVKPSVSKTPTSNSKKQKSFAPANYCFKPPSGLQKMPLFGLVPILTPQEKHIPSQNCTKTPDNITENLTISTSPKLSKQKPPKKLNESIIRDSDESNAIKASIRSSLTKQAMNQTFTKDSQEEEVLSSSTDVSPPQKVNCSMEDLIIFSPYLTRSRGKRNSRKEVQQKLGIGRPSDEIPTKDTVMQNLNICVEEEERTAQYFKLLLNKETDRLNELCKKWLDIASEKNIPEDAMYEIQQAVGQTNLLINKKFERFRGLVQDCETGRGEMLVTCRDLQGFWDMTYMEVADCDARLEKLKQRQNEGWKEEEYNDMAVVKSDAKKPMKIMPVKKKQTVSSKPSSLRSLILAARKNKMKAGISSNEDLLLQDINVNEKPNSKKSFVSPGENTQRSKSKFHDFHENKSTPAPESSKYSNKSKEMKSPFAAMKISQKCKTPEVQLDDTVSYVNSDQTPGKSILKKFEELENKEARIKSAHKVNFEDRIVSTEVPHGSTLDLSVALRRIDDFDLDEIYNTPCINAERRLNFEFEDSDSTDDLNEFKSKIQKKKRNKSKSSVRNTSDNIVYPLNDITSLVPIEESSSNNMKIISPRKSLKNRLRHKDQIENASNRKSVDMTVDMNTDDETFTVEISKDMEDLDLGIKVLRNRTVPVNNTPKSSRTSKMMTPKRMSVNKEENKSHVKSNRKSVLKLSQKDENITPIKSNTMEMENGTINSSKRRSLRKSVAFDENCVVCAENKPVLPMTPHSIRRSLRRSRVKCPSDEEDLISWETPNKKYRKF